MPVGTFLVLFSFPCSSNILTSDPLLQAEHRTMAAFVLAKIVNNYVYGQEAALKGNMIAFCLEQLGDPHHLLRQWLALCLGKVGLSCALFLKFHGPMMLTPPPGLDIL